MTVRELYELNRNNKTFIAFEEFCEDTEYKNSLHIVIFIEDTTTGEYPFCNLYSVCNGSVFAGNIEHNEIFDREVKTYYIETDYQDSSSIILNIQI